MVDQALQKARIRLRVVVIVLLVCFGVIIARVSIFIFSGEYDVESKPSIVRGQILDRRGIPLAVTEEASTIGISPRDMHDMEFTAGQLAGRIGMTEEEIIEKFYLNRDKKYFTLRRQVDDFQADRIADLNLPGVHRQAEYRRFYPGGTLASNTVGFVGRDQVGLDGLERLFGYALMKTPTGESGTGTPLSLTLDALMQIRLEKAMGDVFERSGAKAASGIIMDVRTGEILAVANFPNFDPNEYYRSTPAQRRNWAFQLNYEPGSTIKVFLAAALLAEHAVSPNDKFRCEGELQFYSTSVRCKSQNHIIAHGDLTLPEIIQKSCNVGIIKASQRLKKERLFAYMTGLGFGQRTGVLPQGGWETSGYFPELKNWVLSTGFYMPIGQGFSVTPIQLLRAGASLANGGQLLRPYIVRRFSQDGGGTWEEGRTEGRANPFPAPVNLEVMNMMRRVVTMGTGRLADVPGMPVAGKTGTGQKSSAQGYTEKYVASFMGFFPADNPRYAALILFDEAGNQESGGSIAAPAFAAAVTSILPLIQAEPVTVPPLTKAPVRLPHVDPSVLHDFGGLSAREALGVVSKHYRIPVEIKGSGYVYRQSPEPGVSIQKVDKIVLFLGDPD